MLDSDFEERLEAELKQKKAPSAEAEEVANATEIASVKLAEASDLLKRCAVLFSFLSDPNFCKSITKRYREIMDNQVDTIYTLTDELDKTVEFLDDEDAYEEEDV